MLLQPSLRGEKVLFAGISWSRKNATAEKQQGQGQNRPNRRIHDRHGCCANLAAGVKLSVTNGPAALPNLGEMTHAD
jgi:hypothetical protein